MKLHAKNIATMAGAQGNEVDLVSTKISEENNVTRKRAKQILFWLRHQGS
jgi:hydroxymethylglutaryl-CoA reductase